MINKIALIKCLDHWSQDEMQNDNEDAKKCLVNCIGWILEEDDEQIKLVHWRTYFVDSDDKIIKTSINNDIHSILKNTIQELVHFEVPEEFFNK